MDDEAAVLGCEDAAVEDRPHGGLAPVGDLGETRKVVLADDQFAGAPHLRWVQVVPGVEDVAPVPERARLTRHDRVAVLLLDRVPDGVKVVSNDARIGNEHITRQLAIERPDQLVAAALGGPAHALISVRV